MTREDYLALRQRREALYSILIDDRESNEINEGIIQMILDINRTIREDQEGTAG